MKRFLWLGFVLFLYVICTGCGDTFRPIIIPNPPIFPSPKAAHTVVAINDNGSIVQGSAMVIDVSGDTVVSIADCSTPLCVGVSPVHAVQQTSNQVLVVSHSADSPAADSISKLNFSGLSINSTTTIGLPAGSAPSFVAVAPTDTTAYVTLPDYVPDPINNPGVVVPSVGVVNTQSNNLVATIPAGVNPVALAVTPDKSKLYVANQGDGTISAFNTADRSTRTITGSLTNPPIWLVARTDSQRVYVLEQTTGTLASIDTTSTAGPDTLTEINTINVPGATTMTYDPNLNRLYIPGEQQMAIVDVSQSLPQFLAGGPLTISPVLSSSRSSNDVCSTLSPTPVTAAAVAALPDGSRAYVGSYARFEVDVTISKATLNSDGIHTTYTYSLSPTATVDLLPGMVITISNVDSTGLDPNKIPPSDFDGTFTILSVGGGAFEVTNAPTDTYLRGGSGAAPNVCPQVTVIDAASNTIKTPQITIPGVPGYEPFCSNTRFRMMMAAGGDSSRAYLSSCDGGNVNIIDTYNDTYIENLPAPVGSRPPMPPNPLNPPQNPVLLFAGP
ncbi:MAG TPA: hypothetical protein VJX69_00095 [Terriglobales bacterium]|nr:hypothetical protein [Terriglobales bacterium]